MTKFNIKFNFLDRSQEWLNQFKYEFTRLAYELHANARMNAPVDTGQLKRMISINRKNEFHYQIISNAEYSIFVEYGTSPHIIRAKNKSSLYWTVDGKSFFSKSVMHPGTNPYPFMRPARNKIITKLKNLFK